MKIEHCFLTLKKMNRVATIGFFDGVHLGHQFVVRQVAEEARKRGLEAVVVTFDRPPREVVTGKKCPLLTTLDEKKRLILAAGADRCEILPFTPELAALSARQFMQTVLKEQLRVEVLMLGYDNHFGHRNPDHPETFDDYQRYAHELGIELILLPEMPPSFLAPRSSLKIQPPSATLSTTETSPSPPNFSVVRTASRAALFTVVARVIASVFRRPTSHPRASPRFSRNRAFMRSKSGVMK